MANSMDYIDFEPLITKYGESFYLFDSKCFEHNFDSLLNSFVSIYPNFNIAYSYKTNYMPNVCKMVNQKGGYAEVVSEMELQLALKINVKPSNIIWNGPVKNPIWLKKALLLGVHINIDSIEELKEVYDVVNNYPGNLFNIGLRVNYEVDDSVSRFGMDIEGSDFKKSLEIIKSINNIKTFTISCHFANRSIECWNKKVLGMIMLLKKNDIIPSRIDMGGGLFGNMDSSLACQINKRIPTYFEYANTIAKPFLKMYGKDGPELVIEPGTALVADTMKFVAMVKSIKKIKEKYFATIIGSQKNINMANVNPPISVIHLSCYSNYYDSIDIVGYTCIEGDVVYRGFSGELGVGDLVVVSNCGSYSIVMKPPFILPNFPVLELSNNNVKIIKEKEVFDNIFDTFIF